MSTDNQSGVVNETLAERLETVRGHVRAGWRDVLGWLLVLKFGNARFMFKVLSERSGEMKRLERLLSAAEAEGVLTGDQNSATPRERAS